MTSSDRKKLRKHYKEINKQQKLENSKENTKANFNKQLDADLRADKRVTLTTGNKKNDKNSDGNTKASADYGNSSSFFQNLQRETESTIGKRKRDLSSEKEGAKKQKIGSSSAANSFKL
jgi:hypothetical protein